jgi:Uma2 family endonuclease
MATTTGLVTVAEFEKLPDRDVRQELRHGEVITMPPPGMPHFWVAKSAERALDRILGGFGLVAREFPFCPLPEFECWSADVAFLSAGRVASVRTKWLSGVPDLVVEVLSPSNTAVEMDERRAICLENGCRQFWVVNAERKIVNVSTPDGKTITYRVGDEIDLAEFGDGTLRLTELFGE